MRNSIDKHDRKYCRNNGRSQCQDERSSAIADARKLLRRMKGEGWSFHVFENLGWHFHVINGPICVIGSEGYYFAMLSDDFTSPGTSPCEWSPRGEGHFSDPNKAVKYVVEYASKVEAKRFKALSYAQKVVMEGAYATGG